MCLLCTRQWVHTAFHTHYNTIMYALVIIASFRKNDAHKNDITCLVKNTQNSDIVKWQAQDLSDSINVLSTSTV